MPSNGRATVAVQRKNKGARERIAAAAGQRGGRVEGAGPAADRSHAWPTCCWLAAPKSQNRHC
eukprot:scaffold8616_cov76-Phaeocystis_antarctica.AAC.10